MYKFFMILFLTLITLLLTWDAGLFYTAGSSDLVTIIKAFAFAGFAEIAMILFSRGVSSEERAGVKVVLILVTAALFIGTNFAAGFSATKSLREMQAKAEQTDELAKVITRQKEEKRLQLQEFGKGQQRLNYAKGVNRSDELAKQELQLYSEASLAPETAEVALFFLVRICLSFCLIYFPSRLQTKKVPVSGEQTQPQADQKDSLVKHDEQSLPAVESGPVKSPEIPVDFYGSTPALILKNNQLRNIKGRPASMAKLTPLNSPNEMEESRQYLAVQGEKKGLIRKGEERLESYIDKKWKALSKARAEGLLNQSQIFSFKALS